MDERGGDADGAAEAQAQGHDADVLAGRVGQLALEVILREDGQGTRDDGDDTQDEHDELRERIAHGLAGQDVEADHDEHRALEQDAGKQGGHGAGRLGVGVGQPGVHGEQASLGAEADGGEHEGDLDEGGVEALGDLEDARPEDRLGGVGHDCIGVGVDKHGAVQAEGDAGGADDDVLPRGLKRELGVVGAHEEDRGERGELDGGPHHDDVVRGGGHEHRENEQAEERVVLLDLARAHRAALDVVTNVRQRVGTGEQADDADERHEDGTQVVQAEPQPRGIYRHAGDEHLNHEVHRQAAHGDDAHHVERLVEALRHCLGGRDRHDEACGKRNEDEHDENRRKRHDYPPNPSVPQARWRRALP